MCNQAFIIARQQQAKAWELRAATSPARLWQSQGKRQAAQDLIRRFMVGSPRDLTLRI